MEHRDIVTDYRGFTDYNAGRMIDQDTLTGAALVVGSFVIVFDPIFQGARPGDDLRRDRLHDAVENHYSGSVLYGAVVEGKKTRE